MNIDELTIGQAKELTKLFGNKESIDQPKPHQFIGKKVIIRTYSAGVWFGTLEQKDGSEVILTHARRMWRWWAAKSITLSGVALYGIKQDESRIAPAVPHQWIEAIEITPCSPAAICSIEGAKDAEAS